MGRGRGSLPLGIRESGGWPDALHREPTAYVEPRSPGPTPVASHPQLDTSARCRGGPRHRASSLATAFAVAPATPWNGMKLTSHRHPDAAPRLRTGHQVHLVPAARRLPVHQSPVHPQAPPDVPAERALPDHPAAGALTRERLLRCGVQPHQDPLAPGGGGEQDQQRASAAPGGRFVRDDGRARCGAEPENSRAVHDMHQRAVPAVRDAPQQPAAQPAPHLVRVEHRPVRRRTRPGQGRAFARAGHSGQHEEGAATDAQLQGRACLTGRIRNVHDDFRLRVVDLGPRRPRGRCSPSGRCCAEGVARLPRAGHPSIPQSARVPPANPRPTPRTGGAFAASPRSPRHDQKSARHPEPAGSVKPLEYRCVVLRRRAG